MKTKILLTLSLSFFCINGLARLKTPKSTNITPEYSPAFKSQKPLRSAENCTGGCIELAKKSLSPKAVKTLNDTPSSSEKGSFMRNLPFIYDALYAHSNIIGSSRLSINGVKEQTEKTRWKALKGTTALASALQKSVHNVWSKSAKDNLENFVKGLAVDGVNTREEAEKLKQVEKNCI